MNWGYPCTDCASCRSTCLNPFNGIDYTVFFGPQSDEIPIKPHPCFISWLAKNRRIGSEPYGKDPTDIESLLRIITEEVENLCQFDDDLKKWHQQWQRVQNKSAVDQERTEAVCQIMRLAVSDGDSRWFYSFCRGYWRQTDTTSHCPRCGECVDWREWHCKKCNKCVYGLSIPGEKCGGVSDMYHSVHKSEMN